MEKQIPSRFRADSVVGDLFLALQYLGILTLSNSIQLFLYYSASFKSIIERRNRIITWSRDENRDEKKDRSLEVCKFILPLSMETISMSGACRSCRQKMNTSFLPFRCNIQIVTDILYFATKFYAIFIIGKHPFLILHYYYSLLYILQSIRFDSVKLDQVRGRRMTEKKHERDEIITEENIFSDKNMK